MAKTANAAEILKRKKGIEPDTDAEMLKISEDLRIAHKIYDARSEVGLTQKELVKADYFGG